MNEKCRKEGSHRRSAMPELHATRLRRTDMPLGASIKHPAPDAVVKDTAARIDARAWLLDVEERMNAE